MTRWWKRLPRLTRHATGGTLPTRPPGDDTIPAVLSGGGHSWDLLGEEAYDFPEEQLQRLIDAMPADPAPLHAHEITPADAAVIRILASAHSRRLAGTRFEDDATVVLPSGRAITGAEMRRWLEGGTT